MNDERMIESDIGTSHHSLIDHSFID